MCGVSPIVAVQQNTSITAVQTNTTTIIATPTAMVARISGLIGGELFSVGELGPKLVVAGGLELGLAEDVPALGVGWTKNFIKFCYSETNGYTHW